VRTFLFICSFLLGLAASAFAAESLSLKDGSTLSGDIVKFDDYDVMIHTPADTYSNVPWSQFSQDSLKQLSTNPKYRAFAEPFIEPTAASRPAKAEVRVQEVKRLPSPDQLHPSLLGGLFHSSLGLFLLLLIYVANLYAAFEVSVVRGKPPGVVIGLSAILPIVGPIIFLSQAMTPESEETPAPEAAAGAAAPPAGSAPLPGQEDIQIVASSWQPATEEKKPQPQVFSRGAFTFNKRFIETKFAPYIGSPKGDALKWAMEVKTLKETFAVTCINQVGAGEVVLETVGGALSVPFGDIQEVKLVPKPA
jgi:hypothetical protein